MIGESILCTFIVVFADGFRVESEGYDPQHAASRAQRMYLSQHGAVVAYERRA